jgi:hypothetical protein
MTYVDLLLSALFLLVIYLVLELKDLRNMISYYLEPPQDSNFDDRHQNG